MIPNGPHDPEGASREVTGLVVTAGTVEQGRAAFARRGWREAYELLSSADRTGPLAPADLDRLAVAAYLTGADEDCARAWERAHHGFLAAGAVARGVRCGFWLGLTLLLGGQPARGGGWIARGQRLLDDASLDCVERGYLRLPAALRALIDGEAHTALALFQEAVAAGERFGEPDLVAMGRLGRGQALIAMGEAAPGVSMLDEAMVGVTTGEVSALPAGIIYCAVILACRDVFDLRRAQEWTAALTRWCAEQPDLKPYRGQCLVHRSEIMQLRGDWADALAEVGQACAHLSDPPGNPVLGMALYQQAELLRLRGELAQAEQTYRRAGDHGYPVHPGMALLRLVQGRAGDAAAGIRLAVGEADGQVARSRMLAAFVEIMLNRGEVADARAAADELVGTAAEFDSPHLRAVAGHAQGAVLLAEGDVTGASAALRRAWTQWCELDAPYEAARTRTVIGVARARSGDMDGAHLEWEGARQVFVHLGAAPDVDSVDTLAQPAHHPAAGRLTAREVEVLRLVAAGRSNREIASALVVSEHTVRRHLQNIFAKIGVTSRAGATGYAYRHGLT